MGLEKASDLGAGVRQEDLHPRGKPAASSLQKLRACCKARGSFPHCCVQHYSTVKALGEILITS